MIDLAYQVRNSFFNRHHTWYNWTANVVYATQGLHWDAPDGDQNVLSDEDRILAAESLLEGRRFADKIVQEHVRPHRI